MRSVIQKTSTKSRLSIQVATRIASELPTITIGGVSAAVSYAGSAPNAVAGVYQVNVQIPAGTATGAAPVVLQAGGASSPSGVTIEVQ